MSSPGARGEGSLGCRAIGWLAIGGVRDKARVVMSMMFVLETFLGGFLMEDEALENILKKFRKFLGLPISSVHACCFAWNMKDLGKVVERKNDLLVSNDKGDRDCLVDISSDPNTLVEFENKQRTNFFVDIQKTIKVDGEKDLANV
ncbi:hypothetical protein Tco_1187375 [Tanacetum coccineum]